MSANDWRMNAVWEWGKWFLWQKLANINTWQASPKCVSFDVPRLFQCFLIVFYSVLVRTTTKRSKLSNVFVCNANVSEKNQTQHQGVNVLKTRGAPLWLDLCEPPTTSRLSTRHTRETDAADNEPFHAKHAETLHARHPTTHTHTHTRHKWWHQWSHCRFIGGWAKLTTSLLADTANLLETFWSMISWITCCGRRLCCFIRNKSDTVDYWCQNLYINLKFHFTFWGPTRYLQPAFGKFLDIAAGNQLHTQSRNWQTHRMSDGVIRWYQSESRAAATELSWNVDTRCRHCDCRVSVAPAVSSLAFARSHCSCKQTPRSIHHSINKTLHKTWPRSTHETRKSFAANGIKIKQ